MKKVFFKKLQSLTAILVLNTVPVSFAQTNSGYSTQSVTNAISTNETRETIERRKEANPEDVLGQLYLQNSLEHVQSKSAQQAVKTADPQRYHMALAMVEEAYQDDFDDVLDTYEQKLQEASQKQSPDLMQQARIDAEQALSQLKEVRANKVAEFSRQFGAA